MALLPSSSRDKKMLLYGVLPIVLAATYWYLLWNPQNVALDEVQAHVDSLAVVNQTAKAELAQGKTAQLKAEVEQYTQDLEVMRRLVPPAEEACPAPEQGASHARA